MLLMLDTPQVAAGQAYGAAVLATDGGGLDGGLDGGSGGSGLGGWFGGHRMSLASRGPTHHTAPGLPQDEKSTHRALIKHETT